jgi:hypothetical protein
VKGATRKGPFRPAPVKSKSFCLQIRVGCVSRHSEASEAKTSRSLATASDIGPAWLQTSGRKMVCGVAELAKLLRRCRPPFGFHCGTFQLTRNILPNDNHPIKPHAMVPSVRLGVDVLAYSHPSAMRGSQTPQSDPLMLLLRSWSTNRVVFAEPLCAPLLWPHLPTVWTLWKALSFLNHAGTILTRDRSIDTSN